MFHRQWFLTLVIIMSGVWTISIEAEEKAVPKCNESTQFDCGGGICIPISKVCDRVIDCPNSSDEYESRCPINKCDINNGGCSHNCVDGFGGGFCTCNPGYTFRVGSNTTCEDIDECKIPGSCSQTCVNSIGSFKCECLQGYAQDPKNRTKCIASNSRPSLLVCGAVDISHNPEVRHGEIFKIDLDDDKITGVVNVEYPIYLVDINFKTQEIFWNYIKGLKILSANIEDGNRTTVRISDPPVSAHGIAVDWIHDNLYWTEFVNKSIEVANLGNNFRKTLIKDDIVKPRAIALNPMEGWMFWSDWNTPAKIEKAGMDGSRRTVIVSSDIVWPNGITLDFVQNKIYWVDGMLNTISSCFYDGTERKVILHSTIDLRHPFSITIFEDCVYWSDVEHRHVFKANKFTGDEVEVVLTEKLNHRPAGILVYHPYRQPSAVNYCLNNSKKCSHLCLRSPNVQPSLFNITCACPDGSNLMEDGQTCEIQAKGKVIHKCDESTQFDCGGGFCISNSKVCDRVIDCPDSSDEYKSRCPVNKCDINNGGCSHNCVDGFGGAFCTCNPGYAFRVGSNTTCEDIDECKIPGSCSQTCVNSIGSFKCECLQGYVHDPKNRTKCIASNWRPSLLVCGTIDVSHNPEVKHGEIFKVNLDDHKIYGMESVEYPVYLVDINFKKQEIFWNYIKGLKILSANIKDGTTVRISDPPVSAHGIAVDWIHDNLYWTEFENKSIEVANLGNNFRKILIKEDIVMPRAIALNPMEGWMFWSDWNTPAKIEKAGMDGSRRTVIVSSDIVWPNGITLDFVQNKIYWVDGMLNTISSCFYDGTERKIILHSTKDLRHPFSITIFEDWVYWSDVEHRRVFKANKFTGDEVDVVLTEKLNHRPAGILVYHPYRQPSAINYCLNNLKKCSHLCLRSPNVQPSLFNITCACPDGSKLMDDGQTCEIQAKEEAVPKCNESTQFDCGGGICIPISKVCDRVIDCPNSSDEYESRCPINKCDINNGGCSHNCVDGFGGGFCTCDPGYAFRVGSNTTCEDIDECTIPGSCSQTCINSIGSFKCECLQGYVQGPKNRTKCIASNSRPSLLVCGTIDVSHNPEVKRGEIFKIDLDDHKITEVVNVEYPVYLVDINLKTQEIFWNYIKGLKILSANIEDGNRTTVRLSDPPVSAHGIAVDWIHDNLYWTEFVNKSIEVMNLGNNFRKILIKEDIVMPRAIALNPMEGWMFWSDWNDPAKIEKAGMDGSRRTVIVSSDIVWPNGITLDFVQNKIYWVDGMINTISSCFYDGSERKDILHSTKALRHPFSITIFEDWVYWSDVEHRRVFKANKFTGDEVEVVLTEKLNHRPAGILVYHPYRQPSAVNYCLNNSISCSHLCLRSPSVESPLFNITCACPDGLNLMDDGQTCETQGNIMSDDGGSIAAIVSTLLIIIIASGLICLIFRNHLHRDIKFFNLGNPQYKKVFYNNENATAPEIANITENEPWIPNSNSEFNNSQTIETVQLL